MKIITKLALSSLLFASTLTFCTGCGDSKEPAAAAVDSTKVAIDTITQKVDSALPVVVDTLVKKDSGHSKDVITAPHKKG